MIGFLPIAVGAILFGLAMDYQVFLVSQMRESYVTTQNPDDAVMTWLGAAAAIIMIFVFGSFIFGGQPAIMSIGLALAFGVLADAFLVRMTLVPRVAEGARTRAWNLPGPVDRCCRTSTSRAGGSPRTVATGAPVSRRRPPAVTGCSGRPGPLGPGGVRCRPRAARASGTRCRCAC